jgi:hypothetical protein
VAAAIFAWSQVTATMIAVDESYWELVLMQQILQREILLGDQIPKYVAQFTLYQFGGGELYEVILFAQRKRVTFQKEF